ncbi:hypothetical protein V8C86DRAFT_2725690, partial [Haematococcus lacustris]
MLPAPCCLLYATSSRLLLQGLLGVVGGRRVGGWQTRKWWWWNGGGYGVRGGYGPCWLLVACCSTPLPPCLQCYTCHAPAIDNGSPGCRSKRLLLAA